jgi:hypothetical protein
MELTFEEEQRRSDLIHKLKQSKISAGRIQSTLMLIVKEDSDLALLLRRRK